VVDRIEESTNVRVEHPTHLPSLDRDRERVECLVGPACWSESIGEAEELLFVYLVQNQRRDPLDELVFQSWDPKRPLPAVWLRDVYPSNRLCSIRSPCEAVAEISEVVFEVLGIALPRGPVDARRGVLPHVVEDRAKVVDVVAVMPERVELLSPVLVSCFAHSMEGLLHGCPALHPVHGVLHRVSLGRAPSLHGLRGARRGVLVVRSLLRYYALVRLLMVVHRRCAPSGFSSRAVAAGAVTVNHEISQFPSVVIPHMHEV
jgi:hypothetical protein